MTTRFLSICPACGTGRVGAFRFCLSCGLDFDRDDVRPMPALVAASPTVAPGIQVYPDPELMQGQVEAAAMHAASMAESGWVWWVLCGLLCVAGLVAIATADLAIPQPLRMMVAPSIVLVIPGLAIDFAIFGVRRLTLAEHMLVIPGMSLALATCTAVLLGASPIGLTGQSFAISLGVITLGLTVPTALRSIAAATSRRQRSSANGGPSASNNPRS